MPTPFQNRVYALCKKIPRGKVSTYKEIGKALGGRGQIYRAVGMALKNNTHAPVVPCHRVVASNGAIGGYHGSTRGTFIEKKIKLLQQEGVLVKDNKIIHFKKKLYRF